MYKDFTTKRLLLWRFLLEEYSPTMKYMKDPDIGADDDLVRIIQLTLT